MDYNHEQALFKIIKINLKIISYIFDHNNYIRRRRRRRRNEFNSDETKLMLIQL